MKILFKLNHPAHYHLFKNLIKILRDKSYDIVIVIKNKDILRELLNLSNENYIELIEPLRKRENDKFSVIFNNFLEILKQDFRLFKLVKRENPDLMIGTDTAIAHVGYVLKIPSIILNEDDYSVNKLFCLLTYPFATKIISPEICDVGKFKSKKISYNGYQKLAYLHPNFFKPDINIAKKYFDLNKKNFLIRLVSFTAGHDIESNHKGLDFDTLKEIINILKNYGNVHISSEKKIISEFQKYILNINPLDIHHVLAFTDLFISDSQSMTIEAAILGTPSIRVNTFVGKISVLNEIERKYELSYGINNRDKLVELIYKLVENPNLKNDYYEKKNKLLNEKINTTEFLLSLIEASFRK
jgi:predicted glycosyltransferase